MARFTLNTLGQCFFQVCTALRKMTSVLRLGVYRERIETYVGRASSSVSDAVTGSEPATVTGYSGQISGSGRDSEELLTVTLERHPGRQLGIRLSAGNVTEPGIFISDIQV